MFKKIHSNRDPGDTLFREIRKEFGGYFSKAEIKSRAFIEHNSRLVFKFMVGSMLISIVLCFTVLRKTDTAVRNKVPGTMHRPALNRQPAIINDGFSKIMNLSSALHEMIALKKQVDSISAKKDLTPQDSLMLEKDLDRLQQMNNRPNGAHEHLKKNN